METKVKDVIKEKRDLIKSLQDKQDQIFQSLCCELGVENEEDKKDWLFDYVYNNSKCCLERFLNCKK